VFIFVVKANLNVIRYSVSADLNYVLLTHDVEPVINATLRYVHSLERIQGGTEK